MMVRNKIRPKSKKVWQTLQPLVKVKTKVSLENSHHQMWVSSLLPKINRAKDHSKEVFQTKKQIRNLWRELTADRDPKWWRQIVASNHAPKTQSSVISIQTRDLNTSLPALPRIVIVPRSWVSKCLKVYSKISVVKAEATPHTGKQLTKPRQLCSSVSPWSNSKDSRWVGPPRQELWAKIHRRPVPRLENSVALFDQN